MGLGGKLRGEGTDGHSDTAVATANPRAASVETTAGQSSLGTGGKHHVLLAPRLLEPPEPPEPGEAGPAPRHPPAKPVPALDRNRRVSTQPGAGFPKPCEGPGWRSPSRRGRLPRLCLHLPAAGQGPQRLGTAPPAPRAGFGQPLPIPCHARCYSAGMEGGKSNSNLSTAPRNIPAMKQQCSAPLAQQTWGRRISGSLNSSTWQAADFCPKYMGLWQCFTTGENMSRQAVADSRAPRTCGAWFLQRAFH